MSTQAGSGWGAVTPLTVAAGRPSLATSFTHARLPGVKLRPRADGIDLCVDVEGSAVVVLLPAAGARCLASALYAFAELIEPKREARGSGWRPS